jgi:hypothetical protein
MDIAVDVSGGPVEFAEPSALVTVAAWADRVIRRNGRITVKDGAKSRYAWNVGLLRALARKTPFHTDVRHQETWFPLCRADEGFELTALGANLGVFLNVPGESARAALSYTISEVVRNAAEHSETKGGVFFAGGYFRNRGRVTFAVADAGIGIKGSLISGRVIDSGHSDAEAIERAVQPHVTGAGRGEELLAPNNAGLGLYVTRKIVEACDGEFYIQSRSAGYYEHRGVAKFSGAVSPWDGTVVEVTVRPDRMPDFSPLFDKIAEEVSGFGELKLHFTKGPREARVLSPPVDATGFAADKDWFIRSRQECFDELSEGGLVEIAFQRAKYTTQSAVHALLYEPIRLLGPQILDRIWFSEAGKQIRAVLRHVIGYSLHRLGHEDSPSDEPQE